MHKGDLFDVSIDEIMIKPISNVYSLSEVQTHPAMMIKSVNTFVTTSAMFAELTHLRE